MKWNLRLYAIGVALLLASCDLGPLNSISSPSSMESHDSMSSEVLSDPSSSSHVTSILNDSSSVDITSSDNASSEASSAASSSATSATSSSSASIPSSSVVSSSSNALTVISNAPNYYASVSPSLSGSSLKTALFNLIDNANVNYDWSRFEYIDQDVHDTGRVMTIYARRAYLKSDHVSGNAPAKWNREHSYPQSKISSTAAKDNHHIFADDWKTNSERGNLPFGDVSDSEANRVKDSSGLNTDNFRTSSTFEPNDEAKGQVARATFYVNLLYGHSVESNFASMELAIRWALEYPVDDWSMLRNNRVYTMQGNRNPFVDHPEYICKIYGATNNATQNLCA